MPKPKPKRKPFARTAETTRNIAAKTNTLLATAVQHQRSGRLDEAHVIYDILIGANPCDYISMNNLGLIACDQGRGDEAEALYRKSAALNHHYTNPLINLGNLFHSRKKFPDAICFYEQALQTDPDSIPAHVNLGNLLRDQGNHVDAIASYNRALAVNPDIAEAHLNLGNVLIILGQLDEAVTKYKLVLSLQPDNVLAHANMGVALLRIGAIDRSQASLEQALRIEPNNTDALLNMGNVFVALGRTDESVQCFQRILELKPDHAGAQTNLLSALNYSDSITPAAVARQCLRIGEMMEQRFLAARPHHRNKTDPGRRLRIGYVSPDFRRHAVSYFLEPLFFHDRSLVEIFCYAEVVAPDHITDRFRSFADHWLSTLGIGDDDLAARIREDGIDILIDLAGHTDNNRLPVFARRPAPVQMTWLGYPNTTGLKSIDYRLVDARTDPPGAADQLASETLLRLDGCFLCYKPAEEAPPPMPPPCVNNGFVTFGSFNNLAKISDASLDVWGRLLARVPTARLLLKSRFFAADDSRTRFLARLDQHGVSPERVILLGPSAGTADQLAAYHQVDIALDSFPYNGTTTTCEALWMGVPVVVLAGASHCSRTGLSLLAQTGLSELIARDQEDYIGIAAELANDTMRLAALRQQLRGRMAASPLCDAPAFARKLEAVYRTVWNRWCAVENPIGEVRTTSPETFSVRLSDGIVLALPPSLGAITTYVGLEQEAWFEKEAGFPSRWLKPGMTAIDIGANVGVYSLPMARAVAPSGHVIAYEPGSAAASLLEQSRDLNSAANLTIVRMALSDGRRTGRLVHGSSSELNKLGETDVGEPVNITCLDEEDRVQNWKAPDFVKIDAEGEEQRILRGGLAFFTRHSPLVMFAASSDQDARAHVCEAFRSLGYHLYRLLAGAPVLVPESGETLDPYELNLFAAKPDRAAALARDGWLVEALPDWRPDDTNRLQALDPLRQLPCAAAFSDLLSETRPVDASYRDCLAAFAVWRSPTPSLSERCAALEFAWTGLVALNQSASSHARLLTLARVAWEAGRRAVCVQALRLFLAEMQHGTLHLEEPFWPPSICFEPLTPVGAVADWVIGSAIEQLERTSHHSSLYTALTANVEWLCSHSLGSAQMERRRVLVRSRAGQRTEVPQRLRAESAGHVNAALWGAGGVPNTSVPEPRDPIPADLRPTAGVFRGGRGPEGRVVVDGYYFRFAGGIARVWTEILARFQDSEFARRIVVLNRGFMPGKLSGLEVMECPPLDYNRWEDDHRVVQELCDKLDASLFISTYYTRPERTPSLLMVHDMIPERQGFNLSEPQWQQKHDAINYASGYVAISENTRSDLMHYFPATARKPLIVNHLGVSPDFHSSGVEDRQRFHQEFVLPNLGGRSYIMFLGGYPTYKNSGLLFEALSRIDCSRVALLLTAGPALIDKFHQIPGLLVHAGFLDERNLRLAYGCADFLVYPSFYEGAGLPILEAMACRCPVICANTSSMPEMAGDAALLIDPNQPGELLEAMSALASPSLRQAMIERGVQHARGFRWEDTARRLEQLVNVIVAETPAAKHGTGGADVNQLPDPNPREDIHVLC